MFPFTLGGIDDEVIPVVAIGGGLLVAVIGMVTGAIRAVLVSKHREESRREIAAYVAEGSMTPDDGAKLMAAGRRRDRDCGA